MADNKKSFVLYADLLPTVEKLPDNIAGSLFKTILRYVNDLDPAVEDLILQIAFEPIKQQLKRDLLSWEGTKSERSKSGKLGGIKSGEVRRSKVKQTKQVLQSGSKTKQSEANEAVNVNVTVNDNVFIKIGLLQILQSPSEWLKENKPSAIQNLMLSELKGIDTEAIYKKLDNEYFGYSFDDENHVYNSFKKLGKSMKPGYKNQQNQNIVSSAPKPFPKEK